MPNHSRLADGEVNQDALLARVAELERALALQSSTTAAGPTGDEEERLRSFFDLALDPLWDWDIRQNICLFSPGWFHLIGETPPESASLSVDHNAWERMVHPDDLPGALERIQQCLDGKTTQYEAEYRLRTRRHDNGATTEAWRWVRSRGHVIRRDANGVALRMIGSITDITPQKEIAGSLQETARFLSTLISNLPGWVYRCRNDQTWTTEYASDGVERITGYPASAFAEGGGLSFENLIHPDDRQRVHDVINAAVEKNEPFQVVYRATAQDGTEHWLSEQGQGVFAEDGSLIALEGFITDITGSKQAEAALRHTEQRMEREFKALVEHAPDIISRFDRDLRHIYVNPAVERATGMPREAFLGRTHDELDMPQPLRDKWKHCLQAVFKSGKPMLIEFDYPSEDRPRYYESRLVPEFNDAGEVESILTIARDITQRRMAQADLQRSGELQRLLLRELDHRVRNNLAALSALIDISARGAASVSEFAEAVRGRVQAMAGVHGLLSRAHSRTLPIKSLILSLIPTDLIDAATLDGPNVPVAARQATALGMVLQELVANSLKHGSLGHGGSITVQWTERGENRIELLWRENGGPPIDICDPPQAKVGTQLVTGLVRAELQGETDLQYEPDGANHRFLIRIAPEDDSAN
ncbi:MAG TPA: PAS domain-containing protein [Phycisphaerales bacterium]|nr:PAS domain-containing protein [Phycisphaerales bacterium]HRQ75371.1 PAS domain-containing protein [Phycisphaerales bacterium]